MSVKVLKDEELEKHFRVVIVAKDLEKSIANEIQKIAPTIKMQGFRPGKVPASFVRKKYGASIRNDAIQKEVNSAAQKILKDKKLKTISNPLIEDVITTEGKDLEFTIKMELFPTIKAIDYKKIKIEKPVVKVEDKDLDEHLKQFAEVQMIFTKESKAKAAKGDQITIDFVGYVDDKAFEGGAMENHQLVLGSGAFIPGFEDQLIGAKAGAEVTVKVTFPDPYQSKDLAGKEAEFEVKIHAVHKPEVSKIDDVLAQKVGLKDVNELRERSSEMLSTVFDSEVLTMLKMHLFDHLEKMLDFNVPSSMLEREYQMIKTQAGQAEDEEDKKKDDKKLEESYRRIALRRVRIGLFLAQYADTNKIQLTQDDLRSALLAQARNFPGQEDMIVDYYMKNPNALETLKGPIIEDKAVTHLFKNDIALKEKVYSATEMIALLKAENEREIV